MCSLFRSTKLQTFIMQLSMPSPTPPQYEVGGAEVGIDLIPYHFNFPHVGQAGDVKSPTFSHQETIYIAHEAKKKKLHVKIKTNQKPHPGQEAMYQLPHFAPPTTHTGGVGLDIDSHITPTHGSMLQEKASSALFCLRGS